MWLLRNGSYIRVDLEIDPSWSTQDIWMASNLYARFKSMGYTNSDCSSYASACVWKSKWKGTQYNKTIETTLHNICLGPVNTSLS